MSVDLDTILKWIEFDIMAVKYLERMDAVITFKNLRIVQDEFEEDIDKLFNKILRIDEVRKAKSKVIMECRTTRPCTRSNTKKKK